MCVSVCVCEFVCVSVCVCVLSQHCNNFISTYKSQTLNIQSCF